VFAVRRNALLASCALILVSVFGQAPQALSQDSLGLKPGETDRPVPYPVFETPAFERAVDLGTRSRDGRPGPNYWTNYASYDIDVTIDPATRGLTGEGTIVYENRSPDALRRVVVNLYQNLHKEGEPRNREVTPTGGMNLSCAFVDGKPISRVESVREAGYFIFGTKAIVVLPYQITPGEKVELKFCWDFEIPDAKDQIRMGTDDEVFYLGYWYPQMAVYDDVSAIPALRDGWDYDRYLGYGEFYMGYADYDVRITVPSGFLVAATGTLENADEVLSDKTLALLEQARTTDQVVNVVTDSTRHEALRVGSDAMTTWIFRAENVRDVAFAASEHFVWDATHALVGEGNGHQGSDRTMIHAFYRPDAPSWNRAAEFGRFSIEHMAERIMPYPWPHMTAVEGIIRGGMEYPMMTLIGGRRSDRSLFGVTYHELAHMWFPMIVGQDEKEFTWMDEGLTSFNTNEGHFDFWPDSTIWSPAQQPFLRFATTGLEVESMRHADEYPFDTDARGMASYGKPALMLHTLRGIVGNERFYEAFREYAHRWAYKHPTPWDLFNTFEDVLGEVKSRQSKVTKQVSS
jgi:hypothetical protein